MTLGKARPHALNSAGRGLVDARLKKRNYKLCKRNC